MDLDVDFSEISDDKVRSFLSLKLEEIRLQNEALETVLQERTQALKKSKPSFEKRLRIENIWKTIFNFKYAIGFEILSPTPFVNVKIVLTCDFEESLLYNVQTFTLSSLKTPCTAGNNCGYTICGLVKVSDTFEHKAYVIVSFYVPQFLHKLNYDLSGYIISTLEGHDVDVPLPNIQLSTKDTVYQTNWITKKESMQNLFAMVSCSNMMDLVICLPEKWMTPPVSTLEIYCSLTYVPIDKGSDKGYFVANKISDLFDNTMIIMHPHEFKEGAENYIFLKVFTSNNEKLFAFLHHLLSCIPNSIIFPSKLYQSIILSKKESYREENNQIFEEFAKGMRNDINHSYSYARMACWKTYLAENKSYKFNQQRQKLSEHESKTDFQYLEVLTM